MSRRSSLCLAALAATGALAATPASAAYRFDGQWGSEGRGAGQFGSGRQDVGGNRQFDDPSGLSFDGRGNLWVADPSNNRLQKFTPGGRFLFKFGRYGFDPGASTPGARDRFALPRGVVVNRGSLYIVDARNDRVKKTTSRGRFLRRYGRRGALPNRLSAPYDIAIRGTRMYVTDQGNTRIGMWSLGGRWLGSFGRFGNTPGRFVLPAALALDVAGNIYVTDMLRNKILKFSPRRRFITEWGSRGSGPGQFVRPTGIHIDRAGSVFVTDRCNARVQRFNTSGALLEIFGRGRLLTPTWIRTDRRGTVYVSDHHRVVRFAPTSGRAAAASSASPAPLATPASHIGLNIDCRPEEQLP